jgi:hypothetical protein
MWLPGGCRVPGAVGQRAARRAPAGLEQVAVAAAHAQRGAAHGGDQRVRGREVGLGVAEVVGLVAAVARRVVHPDALQGGLAEGVVPGLAQAGVLTGLAEVAVGVRDDLGQPAVDDLVDRVDERLVEAVGAAHEEHVGAGRHRVHGLDVEGLLAVPALRVALVGAADRIVGAILGRDLAEVHRRLAVGRGVLVGVLQDGDDRHRLAVAVEAPCDRALVP